MGVFCLMIKNLDAVSYLLYMKITGRQLREIIREAVSEAVSEANGALHEKLHELAVLIKDRYDALKGRHTPGRNWSFNITREEFKKYNVYNVPFSNLKIIVSYLDEPCSANYYDGTITIYPPAFDDGIIDSTEQIIPVLEHELTHMVQGEGTKTYIGYNDSVLHTRNHSSNYAFAPFEMSARISGVYRMVKQALEGYITDGYFSGLDDVSQASFRDFYTDMWNCLNDYDEYGGRAIENELMLNKMKIIISNVEKDTFENFCSTIQDGQSHFYSSKRAHNSPVADTLLDKPGYLPKLAGFRNLNDRAEFEKYKGYILGYYRKSYENYVKKINKTLAPLVMQYFEQGLEEYA